MIILSLEELKKLTGILVKESPKDANFRSDRELVTFFNGFGFVDGYEEAEGIVMPGSSVVDNLFYVDSRLVELNRFGRINQVIKKIFKVGQVNEHDINIVKRVLMSVDVDLEENTEEYGFMREFHWKHDLSIIEQLPKYLSIREMEHFLVSDMEDIDSSLFTFIEFWEERILKGGIVIYDSTLTGILHSFYEVMVELHKMVRRTYSGGKYGTYSIIVNNQTKSNQLNEIIKFRDGILSTRYKKMKEYLSISYPQIDFIYSYS